jgi:hypothetical protein
MSVSLIEGRDGHGKELKTTRLVSADPIPATGLPCPRFRRLLGCRLHVVESQGKS